MYIEKLIERMNNHLQSLAAYSDPELAHTLEDAATALSTLQAENTQLWAELERVRVERDAYKVYFMDVSSKPDCNTCEKMGCEYRPRVGDTVRANCPLYSGPEKEE